MVTRYLLGPLNKNHGASKVLNSFAKEYDIHYIPFYSFKGIIVWVRSIINRKPVVYAPSVGRFQGIQSLGYLRDIIFIIVNTFLFPTKNHPIYFYLSQIDFNSKYVSPFLYRLISKRIILAPARPFHIQNREVLYYYSESLIVKRVTYPRSKKGIVIWHLGYATKQKGWDSFRNISSDSLLEFRYAGRHEVSDFPADITNETPALYVSNKYPLQWNVLLFLSETDLFPLIVLEAINNGFIVVTIKNTVSEKILSNMFRGLDCYITLEHISDLTIDYLTEKVSVLEENLANFHQLQKLSRKYG